jgi:6-phosphogluconolactonase
MRSTKYSLVLLLLGTGLSAPACGDDDDDVAATAGKGGGAGSAGTSSGGQSAGETSGPIAGGGSTGAVAGTASTPGGAGGDAAAGAPGGEGGAAGNVGGDAGAGGADEAGFHVYVGCSVPEGTLQSYRVQNGTFTPLPSSATAGNISNSSFNHAEDLLYVAHAVGATAAARITTYARNVTTGALSAVGTSAEVPFSTLGTGGTGGTSGNGGTGGLGIGGLGIGGLSLGGTGGTTGATNPLPQTLTLDASEEHLAVPNYGSGNVYIYDILQDGSVGAIVSADAGGLNAHHAIFSHNNAFMLVPYLGSNFIKVYGYDADTGDITPDSTVPMPNLGSSPRHLALHPNGTWLYAINEMTGNTVATTGSIDLFSLGEAGGDLIPAHTFTVPLPAGYSGLKNGAEIEIAPSGNFLYVSMRLDNLAQGSLVVYSISNEDGDLTFVEQQSSRGVTPRHFSLSKDGAWLIVGNQNSANIALFSVDADTGKLSFVAEQAVCTSPRFARFAKIR